LTSTVHTAPVVVTMTGDPLHDAAVVVDGALVVEVGPRAAVLAAHPSLRVREHTGVMVPGLVNAHTHLEYGPRFADLATSGLPFPEWIARLSLRRRELSLDDWLVEVRGSAHAALRTGTTCVGDVVTNGPAVAAVARLGLAGVSYLEAVGADDRSWPRERDRVLRLLEAGGPRLGVSPHALYSLSASAFRSAVGLARERGLRLHPHLAETSDEAEFVLSGTGPIAAAMTRLGLEHDLIGAGARRTAVEHCDDLGGLGPDVHVAHGVHVSASDRELLRSRHTAVALCTRSNAVLQAGEAPVAAYLSEGSPVALGTDSLASSPDLDLLAEARAARYLAARQGMTGTASALLVAATTGGAAALGVDAGTIEPGRRADLAVFDVPVGGGEDLAAVAEALVEHGAGRCTATVLAGRLVHRR
jgi:cytosine/adenosine deaminase-related metal-dependent hydrolase